MMNSLSDPKVILAALSLIVAVIALFYAHKRNPRKSLSYLVHYHLSVLNVHSELKDRVQITLDGKPVEEVYLSEIYIVNDGNAPITQADYEMPVSINFGDAAEVLPTPQITERKPEDLQVSIKLDAPDYVHEGVHLETKIPRRLIVTPMLLNAGEHFAVKALVSKPSKEPKIGGRIVGVREIAKYRSKEQRRNQAALIILFIVLIVPSYIFKKKFFPSADPVDDTFGTLVLSFIADVIILAVVNMSLDFIRSRRKKRKHPLD